MTDQERRFDFTDTLTISAGEDGNRHTIHTNVITASSSQVLEVALSHGLQQGLNIAIPNVDDSTLKSYLHWMYTDCILEREKAQHYSELFALYLLGETLEDTVFCEKVVEALAVVNDGFVWPPLQPDVMFVWERTLPTSPLRRIVREIWLTMPIASSVWAFKESSSLEAPFLMDFVLDLFNVLVGQCDGAAGSGFSGRSFGELKVACMGFVKDAAPDEEQH